MKRKHCLEEHNDSNGFMCEKLRCGELNHELKKKKDFYSKGHSSL